MRRCLIVVAKRPEPGKVKTRIGATIGAEQASELYRCALADTLELVASYDGVEHVISYAPQTDQARTFFTELAPGFVLIPQLGETFGERLLSAFQQLAEGGAEHMVLIGTDNPSLPRSCIDEAFAALDRPDVDAVLGPVSDGGYYLIGMCSVYPILFERIHWSTELVAAETHQRAVEGNLRLVNVTGWYDLDTADDLRKLYDEVSRTQDNRAPRTRAFVERIGLASRPSNMQ